MSPWSEGFHSSPPKASRTTKNRFGKITKLHPQVCLIQNIVLAMATF